MRVRFIKYGKNIRRDNGTIEHAEVSIELNPGEYEEAGMDRAKKFINQSLNVPEPSGPLKATLGEHLNPQKKEQ